MYIVENMDCLTIKFHITIALIDDSLKIFDLKSYINKIHQIL
jgi:hypothetical protein